VTNAASECFQVITAMIPPGRSSLKAALKPFIICRRSAFTAMRSACSQGNVPGKTLEYIHSNTRSLEHFERNIIKDSVVSSQPHHVKILVSIYGMQ
jgi:hypothetical protein